MEREIAKRQKAVDDAKLSIIEGDELIDQRKFGQAVAKYYNAYVTTDESTIALPVHTLARNRFASFSVIYARELAQSARYKEAHQALDRVLSDAVAPDHAPAKEFKRQLDDPERFNPALTPQHLKAVDEVEGLFDKAEGHLKLGNFDAANLTYAAILREDPTNEAARRGMQAADRHIRNYHDSARAHNRAKMMSAVDAMWEHQVPLSTAAFQNASAIQGAVVNDALADRLRTIIIPQIDFTDESLTGVTEYLSRQSRELDPTGVGVNFILNIAQEDAYLRDISVNLTLSGAPLREVLRYVTEQTGTKFRVEQSGVVISSANSASTALVTKRFAVPPDFLSSTPSGDGADEAADPFGGGGNSQKSNLIAVRLNARQYLEQAGVNFPNGAFATHSVSGNTLVVHNTQANIDLVDAIVTSLNSGNKRMVRVSVTSIEVIDVGSDELTFDQLLGQFNIPGSKSVFGSGATPGQRPFEYAFTPPRSDVPVGQNALTGGIRSRDFAIRANELERVSDGDPQGTVITSKAASAFGISAPFGDPQYQMAIRAISQKKTTTITNQPSTLTSPGQRSVIDVSRDFPYPTEYDPPEIPQTFSSQRQDNILIDPVNEIIFFIPGQDPPNTFPVTPANPTAFDVRNIGTRLEVEPTIDPNGYVVTLNLSVEFSQFEGFINYGTPITTSDGAVLTENRILQPLFKVSRLAQPVHVQDGANFVIGGLMNDDVEITNDKTPFLGDIPVLGRLFRGEVSERRRKAVLFFVKVTIVEPNGQPSNPTLSGDAEY